MLPSIATPAAPVKGGTQAISTKIASNQKSLERLKKELKRLKITLGICGMVITVFGLWSTMHHYKDGGLLSKVETRFENDHGEQFTFGTLLASFSLKGMYDNAHTESMTKLPQSGLWRGQYGIIIGGLMLPCKYPGFVPVRRNQAR